MASTYTPIATQTLSGATSAVTFSSIPSTYTDIVFVLNGVQSSSSVLDLTIRFNGDTGTNYSNTDLAGDGSSASSGRNSNHTGGKLVYFGSTSWVSMLRGNVQNYANTTTYKTVLTRADTPSAFTVADVVLWRSTAAINSISFQMTSGNIAAGTFTLYGIQAA